MATALNHGWDHPRWMNHLVVIIQPCWSHQVFQSDGALPDCQHRGSQGRVRPRKLPSTLRSLVFGKCFNQSLVSWSSRWTCNFVLSYIDIFYPSMVIYVLSVLSMYLLWIYIYLFMFLRWSIYLHSLYLIEVFCKSIIISLEWTMVGAFNLWYDPFGFQPRSSRLLGMSGWESCSNPHPSPRCATLVSRKEMQLLCSHPFISWQRLHRDPNLDCPGAFHCWAVNQDADMFTAGQMQPGDFVLWLATQFWGRTVWSRVLITWTNSKASPKIGDVDTNRSY